MQNWKLLVVELSNTKWKIIEEDEEYEFDDYNTNDNDDASEYSADDNDSEFSTPDEISQIKIDTNEGTRKKQQQEKVLHRKAVVDKTRGTIQTTKLSSPSNAKERRKKMNNMNLIMTLLNSVHQIQIVGLKLK